MHDITMNKPNVYYGKKSKNAYLGKLKKIPHAIKIIPVKGLPIPIFELVQAF